MSGLEPMISALRTMLEVFGLPLLVPGFEGHGVLGCHFENPLQWVCARGRPLGARSGIARLSGRMRRQYGARQGPPAACGGSRGELVMGGT